jgi:uncharacterized protein YbjT (DUF2867 family)
MVIAVIGATGGTGATLARRLLAGGHPVVAIGRNEARYRASGLAAPFRRVDLAAPDTLRAALADADKIAICVHARFLPAILPALPASLARIVAMGSTRKFTRFPDEAARQVLQGEAAFEAARLPGVLLHPTMIYGALGERNVQRIAAQIRRFGIVPLPAGGRALVQPIHIDDVAACLEAALFRPQAPGRPVVIAGPEPVSYRELVAAIAHAIGRRARILDVPAGILMAGARLTPFLPGVPRVSVAEVRRLTEDKAFDIAEMRARLGVEPVDLATGLARSVAHSAAVGDSARR